MATVERTSRQGSGSRRLAAAVLCLAFALSLFSGPVSSQPVVAPEEERPSSESAEGLTPEQGTDAPVESTTDDAMEQLLHVVKTDRDWEDQAARKQLLKFFDALGPTHPATVAGRRQLSAVLFS